MRFTLDKLYFASIGTEILSVRNKLYIGIEISGCPVNEPTGIDPKVPKLATSGEGTLTGSFV